MSIFIFKYVNHNTLVHTQHALEHHEILSQKMKKLNTVECTDMYDEIVGNMLNLDVQNNPQEMPDQNYPSISCIVYLIEIIPVLIPSSWL